MPLALTRAEATRAHASHSAREHNAQTTPPTSYQPHDPPSHRQSHRDDSTKTPQSSPPAPQSSSPTSQPPNVSVEHLWREYKKLRTTILRERLVIHYMSNHVRRIAARLHAGLPHQVDIDDLIQEGYLGLIDAMERFDIDRDIRFETFSGRRIFGAMQDYLRKIDPAPRLTRTRTKTIDRVTESFTATHGRPPDDDELRALLDLPESVLRKMMIHGRPGAMVPFSSVRPDGDDDSDESDAMAVFTDDQPTPMTQAEREDLRWFVAKGLNRRDQLILVLYYYEHMTMREIGRTLGISESRVSQRIDAIVGCLRSRFCYEEAEAEFE